MFKKLFALGLGGSLINYSVKCCGIIGVLTTEDNAEKVIFEGVQLLQNRGYDSAGIGTVNKQKELVISKHASDQINKVDCFVKLNQELQKHIQSQVGIGHTRWATCGSKTDNNAHPHSDIAKRVALVHNGTLENYVELKEELIQKGIQFSSDTDSEVIAQLIGQEIQKQNFLEAVESVLTRLRGQWGLAVIDRENPAQMIVCRQGSPLLVGYAANSIFVASEKIAFEKYTQNYIALQDGEVMLLQLENRNQLYNQIKHRLIFNENQEVEQVHLKPKQPYQTFFEMEIHEQPNSLLRCLGNGARLAGFTDCAKLGGLDMKEKELCEIKHLILIGCGSSFNAAQSVLPIYKSFRTFESVQAIEASEFQIYDLPYSSVGIIFITQSGETKDIVRVLNLAKQQGVTTIGVVNVVGSLIATNVDCGVYLNSGREVAVAASKSFTSQTTALILIGLWFSYYKEKNNYLPQNTKMKPLREKYVNQLRMLPMVFGQGIVECQASVKLVAKILQTKQSLFVLGKGSNYSIAKEGALKIKELTYIHAEAFASGEMKHGPLALIDSSKEKETSIILIILDDEFLQDMKLSLSEVHSRNARTIVITDSAQSLSNTMNKIDHLIQIPKIGEQLNWLLSVIVFQLLSLEICYLQGIDPDKPRNLAKTVTVG
ncbi:unnamed protein product (macronuclear) [Paramecium tetraurelia]|uniref:Glutamine--fructose-6-phosphate aminotransferase [isomerizing] n=1 Tax=Paramecium tetraurelia TaxID=5888 RepID=A0E7G4_PARTE|nr:uncharacterized protein GSPATT00023959001 [Paramecium tetraurelia]CAK91231.1 unnamed protein product [Paramecium tetraurelia]|eukprot:XP_001458628.1 hypothetical protein (macronuclear) [Paramecium tetraurelia strain d4-2]